MAAFRNWVSMAACGQAHVDVDLVGRDLTSIMGVVTASTRRCASPPAPSRVEVGHLTPGRTRWAGGRTRGCRPHVDAAVSDRPSDRPSRRSRASARSRRAQVHLAVAEVRDDVLAGRAAVERLVEGGHVERGRQEGGRVCAAKSRPAWVTRTPSCCRSVARAGAGAVASSRAVNSALPVRPSNRRAVQEVLRWIGNSLMIDPHAAAPALAGPLVGVDRSTGRPERGPY